MLPEWQTGIVSRIEQATYNTRRYWIDLPQADAFHYQPGQFVTMDLPIHEQRNRRWRSYSIASAPDGSNRIELVIVLAEQGLGTTYLFNEIKEGSEITMRGPHGLFTMPPQTAEQDLLLICTGTGVAPFRSMVNHIATNNLPHKNVHLIAGVRLQSDLLYHEELKELEARMPQFHYHPTLSREDWGGYKGYVHAIYETLCGEKQPAQFMLCGWRTMVDEAKQRILEMGYDKKSIHLELYG